MPISVNAYVPLCEQYESIAQSFYQQYNNFRQEQANLGKPKEFFEDPIGANRQIELSIAILQAAISAVIFEAFAIESYVNFFGAYILGDTQFYDKYEPVERGKRYSTLDKIKLICKDEFKTPYPTGSSHFVNLKALFTKRDKLAHNKPKGHQISLQSSDSDSEFENADKEISFVFDNIEKDMLMYTEVKANLTACSGKAEPMSAFIEEAKSAIAQSAVNMLSAIKND